MKHLRYLVLSFLALALGAALAPPAQAFGPGGDMVHLDVLAGDPQILASPCAAGPFAIPRAPFCNGPFLQFAERSVRTMVRCTGFADWCSIRAMKGFPVIGCLPPEAHVHPPILKNRGRAGAIPARM